MSVGPLAAHHPSATEGNPLMAAATAHHRLFAFWTVGLSVLLFGCQDLQDGVALRRAVVDRVGWTDVSVGVVVGEPTVEVTLADPGSAPAPADEATAREVARLARAHLDRARRADTVEVSFVVREEARAGVFRSTVHRSYRVPADSVRRE